MHTYMLYNITKLCLENICQQKPVFYLCFFKFFIRCDQRRTSTHIFFLSEWFLKLNIYVCFWYILFLRHLGLSSVSHLMTDRFPQKWCILPSCLFALRLSGQRGLVHRYNAVLIAYKWAVHMGNFRMSFGQIFNSVCQCRHWNIIGVWTAFLAVWWSASVFSSNF